MLTTLSLAESCLDDNQVWMCTIPCTIPGATNTPSPYYGNPHDENCWPVGHNPAKDIALTSCPAGYYRAATPPETLDPSATAFTCCPNNFFYDGGFFVCSSRFGIFTSFAVLDLDEAGNTITTDFWDDGINAHGILVRYYASDIPVATTTTSVLLSSQTSSTFPSTPRNSDIASTTIVAHEVTSNGLSPGATAGIAARAAVLGFATAVACFLLWRRRTTVTASRQEAKPGWRPRQTPMSGHQPPLAQLHGKSITSKLPDDREPQELDSTRHYR